ncbi:MAG: hypothetical protein KF819_39125 [Labilithrix sp.]|nr:hypothetical protein [Labilithrix sp.]
MKVRVASLVGGLGVVGALSLAACAPPATPPVVTTAATAHAHPHSHDPSDHNHARGKMLMASNGTIDALLTAHLSSKNGNELDVFVEQKGAPHALDVTTLEAVARSASGEVQTMELSCAPRDERPAAEPEGKCSHFVATAGWMKPGERLRVEASLPFGDRRVAMVWRDFEPKKYAHHED